MNENKLKEINLLNMEERNIIMEEYGDEGRMLLGKNQNKENIIIHISKYGIILKTMQINGYIKKSYFYYNSEALEEVIDGKWK